MKTLAIIIILSVSGIFSIELDPEQMAIIQTYEMECLVETGGDLDTLESIKIKGIEGLVGEMRCFSSCIFKKFGFLSADGVFEESKFRALKVPISDEKLDLIINDCKNEVGGDICETSNKLLSCVAKYEKIF